MCHVFRAGCVFLTSKFLSAAPNDSNQGNLTFCFAKDLLARKIKKVKAVTHLTDSDPSQKL